MKHFNLPALAAATLLLTAPAASQADPNTAASVQDDSGNYGDSYGFGRGRNLSYLGVLADLVLLRPFGLALTIGGVGLVAATSPLTGLASFAPPHDAFLRVGNALVVGPAGFTFNRPLGEMSYQRSGVYPVLTKPSDRLTPKQVPVPLAPQYSKPVSPAPKRPVYQYSPDRLQYPAGPDDANS